VRVGDDDDSSLCKSEVVNLSILLPKLGCFTAFLREQESEAEQMQGEFRYPQIKNGVFWICILMSIFGLVTCPSYVHTNTHTHLALPKSQTKLGPSSACWLTSLDANNFYAYLCSLPLLA